MPYPINPAHRLLLESGNNNSTISRRTAQDAANTSTTTSVSVSYPGSTVAGNLLWATAYGNTGNALAISGWTGLTQGINSSTAMLGVFYKIADGTETSITATQTAATVMKLHIYEYTGNSNPVTFDVALVANNTTTGGTSWATSTITTTNTSDLILAAVGLNGDSTSPSWSGLNVRQTDARLIDGDLIPGIIETSFAPTASWTGTLKASAIIGAITASSSGSSYLLLEDNSSKLILDEQIALDDPLDAATVSSTTPGLTFAGEQPLSPTTNVIEIAVTGDSGAISNATDSTFATIRAANGSTAFAQAGNIAGFLWASTTTNQYNNFTRSMWRFDMSVIPAGQKIVSATLSLYGRTATDNALGGGKVGITQGAAGTTLVTSDYQNTAAFATRFASDIDVTAWSTSAYNNFDLNAAGLTYLTGVGNGIATLSSRTNYDIDNTTAGISWASGAAFSLRCYGPEQGAGFQPKLVIYTLPISNLTYEVEVDTANTFDSQVSTPTLIAHTGSQLGVSGGTTSSIDTTGANLIIAGLSFDNGGSTNLSDSKGNIWTPLTAHNIVGNGVSQMYYCSSPIVGSGHTFSSNSGFSSLTIQAWSNAAGGAPDVQNGATATAATLATGNITPGVKGEIVVSHFMYSVAGTASIDSSMTISDQANFSGGAQYGSALAYIVQGAAAGINPTWTSGGGATPLAATIVSFKANTFPLLDKTSDLNIGFVDDTTTSLGDDRLLLEDNSSYLLLEDNSSKLAINYDYPTNDFVTYTVPAATLSNSTTYYWRVRPKVQNGGSYTSWSEIRSFTVSSGTSIAITQVAANVTASGGTQVIATVQNATIAQAAATVTASGGTQVIATKNIVSITQVAASVTASGGTQAIATINNVAISQVAASVTASGGTQAVATSNFVAISQVAGSVTATGGTQLVQTNSSNAQVAATVTASGGTQSIATVNIVSIAQVAATVTASGGTQAVATVNKVAITQIAGTVTASGGTQAIATVNNISITQVAGTVTAAGGTQAIATSKFIAITQLAATVTASGGTQTIATVNDVSINQVAATVTASGGTQSIATVQNQTIAQLAATVTATGGTQTLATSNFVAITQTAGTVTASGGTQSTGSVINSSITQVAATVTASGGTQAIASIQNVAITQLAANVTASGGTQTIASINDAAIAQLAASVTASGGTQTISAINNVSIAQSAATITAAGGTQSLSAQIDAVIAQRAATVTATGGTQATSVPVVVIIDYRLLDTHRVYRGAKQNDFHKRTTTPHRGIRPPRI